MYNWILTVKTNGGYERITLTPKQVDAVKEMIRKTVIPSVYTEGGIVIKEKTIKFIDIIDIYPDLP